MRLEMKYIDNHIEKLDDWDLLEVDEVPEKKSEIKIIPQHLAEGFDARSKEIKDRLEKEKAEQQYIRDHFYEICKLWENIVYSVDLDGFVTIEEAKAAAEARKAKEKAYAKKRESEDNVKAWGNLDTDNFHLNLINYKETRTNDDFNKIWQSLRRLNRQLAYKYLTCLPMRARIMFLAEANSNDFTEWLILPMMKAIDRWDSTKGITFGTYYNVIVRNMAKDILVKLNAKCRENLQFVSLDALEGERIMDQIAKRHYTHDDNGKMFMDAYIKLFVMKLAEKDQTLSALFGLLVSGRFTHEEIAVYLGCCKKTVQRKLKEIRHYWENYIKE